MNGVPDRPMHGSLEGGMNDIWISLSKALKVGFSIELWL